MMNLGIAELVIVLLGLLSVAVWLWALIDCLLHETTQGNEKLIWVVDIVATHVIGALLYLLIRRPRRLATYRA